MVVSVNERESTSVFKPSSVCTEMVRSRTSRTGAVSFAIGVRWDWAGVFGKQLADGLITPDILAREDEIEAEEELAEVMEAGEPL